ncbi:MAG: hypothetical protein OSJ70_07955 [Bacilli bacterium]|nr:hypothetical protein [Bacilli bacterium]
MKKEHIILISIIAIVITVALIIFLNKDILKNTATIDEKKMFKISLENKNCDSEEKVIYTYKDGKKIYSKCGEVYYIDNKEKKMLLSEALENELLTIDDISNQMENILGLYDGGTIVYQYNAEKKSLSEDSFKLEVCNKMQGSKDIQFLSITSTEYKCVK